MNPPSITRRILAVLLSLVLLAASAAAVWLVVRDYQSRIFVSKGVTVANHDLSGMTEAQVRDTIRQAVSEPMLRTVTVSGPKQTWTLEPTRIVNVDADTMVKAAYAPVCNATLAKRVYCEVSGEPMPADVKPVYSVDSTAIAKWVAGIAKEVDRRPINASRRIVGYKFKFKKSVPGTKVEQKTATKRISKTLSADVALSSAGRLVKLPLSYPKPKFVEADFKKAIIVSLPECKIRLYNGTKIEKTYPCAPGRPGFPTPTGDFVVDTKLKNAPWINPGTDWAKSMPPVIGPGPDNPMGVRKIGINYGGVFMHGIPPGEFGSIGTHASHGCMRMFPSDVADLFDRVYLKMPVYIRN